MSAEPTKESPEEELAEIILPANRLFAVKIWRDGGTTDGDAVHPCDRTYTACTYPSTAPDGTGGAVLGTGLTPQRTRRSGRIDTAPAMGEGVVGMGYYDEHRVFALYDANEV